MRRSHDALTVVNTITCPNCDSPMRPHRVCSSCGQYRGRQVKEIAQETENNSNEE